MTNSAKSKSGTFLTRLACLGAIALTIPTVPIGDYTQSAQAVPAPIQISQRQQDWDGILRMGRLANARRQVTALVLQLEVLDKPQTSYANAVYQVFARQRGGAWQAIYTNQGARLFSNERGRLTLPSEVIQISQLQTGLAQRFDGVGLEDVELRAVSQIRYDIQGGRRNQTVEWQQVQTYQQIAVVTSSTNLASTTTTTTTTNSRRTVASRLSLAIRQSQVTLPEVIARVSLKPRRNNQFLAEQFLGDFRYRMNQRAEFIRGASVGDRVVVRLYSLENQLIGYSEFEMLANNSAVTLILPNQSSSYGTVRTVYGADSDRDGNIDARTTTYDYFTQVNTSTNNTRVTFLRNTQTINARHFQVQGLPNPSRNCVYTDSFASGRYALISQTVAVFTRNLSSVFTSTPGTLIQLVSLSTRRVSVYEVIQQISTYREYNSETIVVVDRDRDDEWYSWDGNSDDGDDNDDDDGDDDDDYDYDDDDERGDRPRRRNCNQGIGNGSEGCDPGNSRPRGGSNDESGRTPGSRRR